mgnify:CR=1 FL=1
MARPPYKPRGASVVSGLELPVKDERNTSSGSILCACDASGKGRTGLSIWGGGKLLLVRNSNIPPVDKLTPNICEYFALVVGIETIVEAKYYLPQVNFQQVCFISDALVIVRQLCPLLGQPVDRSYKIHSSYLRDMANRVVSLWGQLIIQGKEPSLIWKPRETTALWFTDATMRG